MGSETSFACTECYKTFKKAEYLKVHVLIHSKDRPNKCESCVSTFKDPSAFGRHKKLHLENTEKYVCSKCNKTFNTYNSWYGHKKSHSNERPFKCSDCDKGYKAKRGLDKHVINSHGGLTVVCDLCDKTFPNELYLRNHKKTHKQLAQLFQSSFVPKKTYIFTKENTVGKSHTSVKYVIDGFHKCQRNINTYQLTETINHFLVKFAQGHLDLNICPRNT